MVDHTDGNIYQIVRQPHSAPQTLGAFSVLTPPADLSPLQAPTHMENLWIFIQAFVDNRKISHTVSDIFPMILPPSQTPFAFRLLWIQ